MPKDFTEQRQAVIQRIIDKGFDILSDFDGRQTTVRKILVRNIACGHTFECASGNLLHRNVQCRVCNDEAKRKRCNAHAQSMHDDYMAIAPEWNGYKRTVYVATGKTYRKHHKIINPEGLKRGLAGTVGAYHLDHIVPVRWCFDHGVSPELCAHYTNLQMLGWMDNVVARDYLKEDLNIPEILKEYV